MFEDILQQLNWTEILLALLTAIGGTLAVWYRKKVTTWRKFWHDVFDGLRAIPELKQDVKGIRYYVAPNGGGSLMDAVKRLEAKSDAHADQLDLMSQTLTAENDSDEDIARFHFSAVGETIYVNQLYARWLGVGKDELLGWNYLNFIHPDDIEKVRRRWEQCRAEHRQFRSQHRLVPADGETILVEVIASPVPGSPPARRWVGSIRRVENGKPQ